MSPMEKNKQNFATIDVGEIDLPFVETPTYKHTSLWEKNKQFHIHSDELNRNGFCLVDLNINANLIEMFQYERRRKRGERMKQSEANQRL